MLAVTVVSSVLANTTSVAAQLVEVAPIIVASESDNYTSEIDLNGFRVDTEPRVSMRAVDRNGNTVTPLEVHPTASIPASNIEFLALALINSSADRFTFNAALPRASRVGFVADVVIADFDNQRFLFDWSDANEH